MQHFFYRLDDLQKLLKDRQDSSIFLITGRGSYVASGAKLKLKSLLRGYKVIHFDEVTPNPSIDEIKKAVSAYTHSKCNLILAVGGGSVIDTAKATRVLAAQDRSPAEVVLSNIINTSPEDVLITVPTTAGSGAESTHFAVIYINQRKYSLSHKRIMPEVVVLDARLTYSLPAKNTAASGIDAIAQAMEAYWSVQSTELSRNYSREALHKLVPNIEDAVLKPDPKSRLAMLEGANLAGRAINIAKTTAPHALSYGFTVHYGIAHGQAVSFTLPSFVVFNANVTDKDCQDPRGAAFVRTRMAELFKTLGVENSQSAKRKLESLITTIKLARNLSGASIDLINEGIDTDRLGNNPRKVSKKEAQAVIEKVLTK